MSGTHRIRTLRGPGGAIAAFAGASGVLVALATPAGATVPTPSSTAAVTGSGLAGLLTMLLVAALGGIVLFARNRRTRHRAADRQRLERGGGDR